MTALLSVVLKWWNSGTQILTYGLAQNLMFAQTVFSNWVPSHSTGGPTGTRTPDQPVMSRLL